MQNTPEYFVVPSKHGGLPFPCYSHMGNYNHNLIGLPKNNPRKKQLKKNH